MATDEKFKSDQNFVAGPAFYFQNDIPYFSTLLNFTYFFMKKKMIPYINKPNCNSIFKLISSLQFSPNITSL